MPEIVLLLERYRVDRADGMTLGGPEKLVVLVIKANGGPELRFAMSKIDAMQISIFLSAAAHEVQSDLNKLG